MRWLLLKPDFAEAHMNLGLVYQLQDRSTDAMTEFRRALKIKPGLAGANFFLGVDYYRRIRGRRKGYPLSDGRAESGAEPRNGYLAVAGDSPRRSLGSGKAK